MKKLAPVHPGEILCEEFLRPLEITPYRLAKDTHMPPTRVGEIIKCRRSITADTALRQGRSFGTSAEFWLNLQSKYELEVTSDQ